MDLKLLIRNYLQEARLMQIATAKDNQPWVSSVYFAFDNNLNLYWISAQHTRHSEEIVTNEKVAGTIVLPHKPGQKVRGIQFQGIGSRLGKKESIKALKHYMLRFGIPMTRVKEILAGKDKHVCYGIKPTLYVLFDEVNFPNSPRQELHL